MKKSFREFANRINGFDIPVFGGGLSWNPPVLDIDVARRLLTYLEDRRALYNPYELETPEYVVRSILEIREHLTDALQQLDRSSPLAQSIAAMRAGCRKFVDETASSSGHVRFRLHTRSWDMDEINFFIALGELRATIGFHAAQVAVRYGVDVEEKLVAIFPALPDS